MKRNSILFLILICFYGCDSLNSPIEIREGIEVINNGDAANTVVIVAITDSVKIKKIKLNKGNCGVKNFKSKTIKYGEEASYITNCQNLLNAVIDTDKGEWEFNW